MFDKNIAVKEIMTADVVYVAPTTTLDKVAELLNTYQVHHVPIVKGNKVVGILSSIDVRRAEHHLTLFKTKSAIEFNTAILRSLLAKDLMSSPVATIRWDETVNKAAALFRENLFRALPVLDDNDILVGIVTPYDLMNYAYSP